MPVFPGDPLVTEAEYRLQTADTGSAASAVEDALADAIALAEQATGRLLPYQQVTETLRVDATGRVWPRATPIEAVVDPEDAQTVDTSIVTGYAGLLFQDQTLNTFWWDRPPTSTVTYTGGWSSDTLPVDLRRLLIQIAYDLLHQSSAGGVLSELPSGASSVSVGDVSVSAGAGGTLTSTRSLSSAALRGLRAWRKPELVDR